MASSSPAAKRIRLDDGSKGSTGEITQTDVVAAASGNSNSNSNNTGAVSLENDDEYWTLVSMNIAGCNPSKEAPRGWGQDKATNAIRDELLRTNPDILALQECPGTMVTSAATLFPDYTAVGHTKSHMDYVMLLVRKSGIEAELVPIPDAGGTTWSGDSVPAVLAKLTTKQRGNDQNNSSRECWMVASVHLAPFGDGRIVREMEMKALIQAAATAATTASPFIIAGDTNMRVAEDTTMEQDLGLVDFWKQAGSDWKTKWTWDTKDHGTYFNRYYGDSTRQYNARYDRVYALTQQQQLSPDAPMLSVPSFDLIANQPVMNKFHFLSDHFGISTRFKFDRRKSSHSC